MKLNIFILSLLIFGVSCHSGKNAKHKVSDITDINEPMPGFDVENSDPTAVFLADKVMTAMGGRKAWDETRYIIWTFFGKRKLTWDKYEGMVRIDMTDTEDAYVVNINDTTGQVYKDGQMITQPDTLAKYLIKARNIWINDSYWLVMPFKLKDTGVTLYYLEQDTTMDGRDAEKIQLAFEGVGKTPENIYDVWIDSETHLVSQWAFYSTGDDTEPRFTMPWLDYEQHEKILLSGNRGKNKLTDIQVSSTLPESTFKL